MNILRKKEAVICWNELDFYIEKETKEPIHHFIENHKFDVLIHDINDIQSKNCHHISTIKLNFFERKKFDVIYFYVNDHHLMKQVLQYILYNGIAKHIYFLKSV